MSRSLFGICLILLLALWLRAPFVYAGLPYISDEDEAHHHNRVVNMVKQGEFNPRYFHKPSLHFYLRMPIISAAFLWSVRAQEIQKTAEIVSSDPFGVAGYSFSAYPERILIWDRGFSVALSLVSIALVFLIALELEAKALTAKMCALIAAVSPAAVSGSATVGVDIVMTCACLATGLAALRTLRTFSLKGLCLVAAFAGLAISSKYNALPIVVVPLLVAVFGAERRFTAVFIAAVCALLGFLAGSPYILSSLPLFLDQFAYEIWHYGVAGHVGHQAEPGLAQARFYLAWLAHNAIGWFGMIVLLALAARFAKITKAAATILAFPLLYFILMITQRANFTRNMMVMIPYCALAIGFGLDFIAQRSFHSLRSAKHNWVLSFGAIVLAVPLAWQSISLRNQISLVPESRIEAAKWLESQSGDSALAGQLQFAWQAFSTPHFERIDMSKSSIAQLYQNGYSRVALPKGAFSPAQLDGAVLEQSFPGNTWPQRIVTNPAIDVFRFDLTAQAKLKLVLTPELILSRDQQLICANNDIKAEGHCWLNHRVASIELQSNPAPGFRLEVMSPWPRQSISLLDKAGNITPLLEADQLIAGQWRELELVPAGGDQKQVVVLLSEIHVPASYKIGDDKRRLGLAVRLAATTSKLGG